MIGAPDMARKFSLYFINLKTNIFINTKHTLNSNENKDSTVLSAYLAGLFEGDGHIQISRGENRIRRIVIGITFNLKDLPLCEHLKLLLKCGWIRIKYKENACVLLLHTDKNIIKFIKLINGYLRSPKIFKFNQVIHYLNEKYNLNLPQYNIDQSDIASNNWLAGFIDADGGFYIRYSEKTKLRIACSLS